MFVAMFSCSEQPVCSLCHSPPRTVHQLPERVSLQLPTLCFLRFPRHQCLQCAPPVNRSASGHCSSSGHLSRRLLLPRTCVVCTRDTYLESINYVNLWECDCKWKMENSVRDERWRVLCERGSYATHGLAFNTESWGSGTRCHVVDIVVALILCLSFYHNIIWELFVYLCL